MFGRTTTSPSMIAEPALMCQASSAIFRKRLVQSLPLMPTARTFCAEMPPFPRRHQSRKIAAAYGRRRCQRSLEYARARPRLQCRTALNFLSDIFGNVISPMLQRVEGDDANRIIHCPVIKSLTIVSRSVRSVSLRGIRAMSKPVDHEIDRLIRAVRNGTWRPTRSGHGNSGATGTSSPSALRCRPANNPYTKSTMIAPTTAPINPAPSPGRYHPSAWPR